MNNQKNIVLCGVGGQGTVLASKLLAAAAMSKDIPVMSAETIGMAQRGGSVFSHLRMGNDLYSPMIETGTADLIIASLPENRWTRCCKHPCSETCYCYSKWF